LLLVYVIFLRFCLQKYKKNIKKQYNSQKFITFVINLLKK
jgi:hypothetical protein